MSSRVGGAGVYKVEGSISAELRRFLIKAFVLFVTWRVVYFFLLEPTDFPNKQLIDLVLQGTRGLLLVFYRDVSINADTIAINGRGALTVYKQCNGLDLMVTYLGFLLSLPVSKKRRFVWFVIAGPILIYALNLFRCFLLSVLFYNNFHPHSFTHHEVFNLFIYGFMFFMWGLYSKNTAKTL